MPSVTPISAPFLPISYLCMLELANFGNRSIDRFDLGYFSVYTSVYTAQWQSI